MLTKIDKLLSQKLDFAFETTLATKTYANTILKAKDIGYHTVLVFFWLESVELAIERVKSRVIEGGHNIPEPVIRRRYSGGIKNLFKLYFPICDYWMIWNNSNPVSKLVAEGYANNDMDIKIIRNFETIKQLSKDE